MAMEAQVSKLLEQKAARILERHSQFKWDEVKYVDNIRGRDDQPYTLFQAERKENLCVTAKKLKSGGALTVKKLECKLEVDTYQLIHKDTDQLVAGEDFTLTIR